MGREANALTVSNSFTAARAIFESNAAVNTFRDRPFPDPPNSSCSTDSVLDHRSVFGVHPRRKSSKLQNAIWPTAGTPSNCTDSSQDCHYPGSTPPRGITTSTRTSVMPSCDLLVRRLTICVCPQKTMGSDANS